jgi:L-threonylcarbamoyladenylate synthase
VTQEEVEAFDRCVEAAGVALFPSDTVYGLATGPESEAGVGRLYALKGRPPERPSALMFFDLDLALATLGELGTRTRAALGRLLPGPFTLVLPNPARRYPLACGPRPDRLGVRVPALSGELAGLTGVRRPILQSSANRSGGPEARRLDDVDAHIREGVDLELDGGELPGVPSTVVDLAAYEAGGRFEVMREGAVSAAEVAALL